MLGNQRVRNFTRSPADVSKVAAKKDNSAAEGVMIFTRKGNAYSVCYAGPGGLEEWCAELRARGLEERRAQNAGRPGEVPTGPGKCQPAQRIAREGSSGVVRAKRQPVQQSASRPGEVPGGAWTAPATYRVSLKDAAIHEALTRWKTTAWRMYCA